MLYRSVVLVTLALANNAVAGCEPKDSEPLARTEAGWVRGTLRVAQNGVPYASFRGIPYAKQPLGELRFKELQPTEPWDGILDATTEGPACYQHNLFFGVLLAPQGFSESCIHANVHVPSYALPPPSQEVPTSKGLPIVVFVHGGGWMSGSGDADVNGPEYLVDKDVIVITFNYRLDVLGFMSLGTSKIPGNNGLRDGVTLLRWVQNNARFFGGNPDEITLAGQSAGSTNAHLIALAPVAKGLVKRLWLMSGSAYPSDYTSSPIWAQQISNAFLTILGLNGTDYDKVHDELIQMPIENINSASFLLTKQFLITFLPVQELELPGVTAMLTEDPATLLAKGNGDDIPLVIGFMSNECETFRPRLEALGAVQNYKANPLIAVSAHLLFLLPLNVTTVMAEKIGQKYFGEDPTIDKYVKLCSDTLFGYGTLKYVRDRAARGGRSTYLYKLSYELEYSVLKLAYGLKYSGAAHCEDLSIIFKVNSYPVPDSIADNEMKEWMSELFANFARTGAPTSDYSWPPQTGSVLHYQELSTPRRYQHNKLSKEDQDMLKFFDDLNCLS